MEERSGTITVVDDLTNYDRYVYDFEGMATLTKDINLITNVTIHVVELKDEASIQMKYVYLFEFNIYHGVHLFSEELTVRSRSNST